MKRSNILWKDRKRNFLGLPWTFTIYQLDKERLFITRGIVNSTEDEVRLYRITDLSLKRNLWQKITGTGTIHCDSADQTMRNFDITNIKHPFDVKELLSGLVETSRRENRVYARETMHSGGHGPAPIGMDFDNPDAFDHDVIYGGHDEVDDDDQDGNF